jgi:hypothetical protein
MILLILFEVRDSKRRQALTDGINEYGDNVRLTESSYALKTDVPSTEVHDGLRKRLQTTDALLVVPFHQPYAGHGDPAAQKWLEENLP